MELSKLTSKYQATVPQSVRKFLGLKKGDTVRFEIRGGSVLVGKATPVDMQFAKLVESSLDEWNSEEDDEAFRNL